MSRSCMHIVHLSSDHLTHAGLLAESFSSGEKYHRILRPENPDSKPTPSMDKNLATRWDGKSLAIQTGYVVQKE